jgi:hypothetical protein
LPLRHTSYQTCHKRFLQWVQSRVFRRIAQKLAEDLFEGGGVDIREAFIDGTFMPVKKGACCRPNQARQKAWTMATANAAGIPVSAHIESASPHEVKLVEATIDSSLTPYAVDRIIGDKAYDIDGVDERLLKEPGIELIARVAENGGNNEPKMAGSFGVITAIHLSLQKMNRMTRFKSKCCSQGSGQYWTRVRAKIFSSATKTWSPKLGCSQQ